MTRLTRSEQTARNRELVLTTAEHAFMELGFHRATLDEIAEAAGFSKGVVYSQFTSKAELFLAVLEQRIERRARENEQLAAPFSGRRAVRAIIERAATLAQAEPNWILALIEFRVHAARDPELNERYAVVHRRTVDHASLLLATVYERAREQPPLPPREMAEALFAFGAGAQLELAVNPRAFGGHRVEVLWRLLTGGPDAAIVGQRDASPASADPTREEHR